MCTIDWLGEPGRDLWERETEKMRDNYSKGTVAVHKPLPGLENCFGPLKD